MTFDPQRTPFIVMGGEEPVHRLADLFYDHMDRDEAYQILRDLHPPDLTESREKFFLFLCGWLGGPQYYVEKHGPPRLRMRHAPFPIGETERDQWLSCMAAAMDECQLDSEVRTFLDARFAHVADFMRNR